MQFIYSYNMNGGSNSNLVQKFQTSNIEQKHLKQ